MSKQLLFSVTKKDLEITWYKSGGSGGQKKNKTANSCRIKHPASGVLVTAQERRERAQNLKAALNRLANHPRFRLWANKRAFEIESNKTIDQMVDEAMREENLKVEVLEGSKWKEIDDE